MNEQSADSPQPANNTVSDNTNNAASNPSAMTEVPEASKLVSFNPIVQLIWLSDDTIYFETAYIRKMKNQNDNTVSFARWHKLTLFSR